jgi:hypothetical protein
MNTQSPFFRSLPACLSLSAILLGPGVPVAPAQDLAEVLAELRRTNQRLEGLERRLSGIEALLGGGGAGATLSEGGKSVGIRPVGEDPVPSSPRPVPALPSERGARTEFHRVQELDHANYAIPDSDPDSTRVQTGAELAPDKVRELSGYTESVSGLVIWEGLAKLPAGRYEFQFGWEAQPYRSHRGSSTQRRPAQISAKVTSEADGESFTLEHDHAISDPAMLTVELAEGIYRFRFAAPTDVKAPDPVYYKKYRTNAIRLQYRLADSISQWSDLSPAMLFVPAASQP